MLTPLSILFEFLLLIVPIDKSVGVKKPLSASADSGSVIALQAQVNLTTKLYS